jgi:hypothetical protein
MNRNTSTDTTFNKEVINIIFVMILLDLLFYFMAMLSNKLIFISYSLQVDC